MSTLKIEDQFALKVNQELSEQLDSLMEKITALATECKIGKDEDGKNSPFKNVLSVAIEPPTSLEVIKNFIRYQVGRQGASKIWKNNPKFANALVRDLNSLEEDVENILKRISQTYAKKASKHSKNEQTHKESEEIDEHPMLIYIKENKKSIKRSLHLRLAQQYLGYLSREHIARKGDPAFREGSNSPNKSQTDNQRNTNNQPQKSNPPKPKSKKNR